MAEVAVTASENSGWIPTFVDYLYLSLTNSSAFSPTDTMPLSIRAKILRGVEATAALLTSLLVSSSCGECSSPSHCSQKTRGCARTTEMWLSILRWG